MGIRQNNIIILKSGNNQYGKLYTLLYEKDTNIVKYKSFIINTIEIVNCETSGNYYFRLYNDNKLLCEFNFYASIGYKNKSGIIELKTSFFEIGTKIYINVMCNYKKYKHITIKKPELIFFD